MTSERKSIDRSPPMASTELGVAMLSSILKSKKAIEVNIQIIRTFVLLRKIVLFDNNFRLKLETIEKELEGHSQQLSILFELIEEYLDSKENKNEIGFKV